MLCEQIKGEAEITDNYLCTKQYNAQFSCGHKEEALEMMEGAWVYNPQPQQIQQWRGICWRGSRYV